MADVGVRLAIPEDADELARIQAEVWTEVHAGALPGDLLEAVGSTEAADRWRVAIAEPPSPRHRVLAALVGERVVGFAALAPASDPDTVPRLDAELLALCVDPAETGQGSGSRLVNASADSARGDGFHHLHAWLAAAESDLRGFLAEAGWEEDGATRSLDLRGDGEVVVEQTRLRTALVDL
jgi:GNAT superfamily N-acetyltransferase